MAMLLPAIANAFARIELFTNAECSEFMGDTLIHEFFVLSVVEGLIGSF